MRNRIRLNHAHRRRPSIPGTSADRPATGILTIEAWWRDGKAHRDSAPAVIERDGDTGAVLREECFLNGVRQSPV
jgi:hypothetical protein